MAASATGRACWQMARIGRSAHAKSVVPSIYARRRREGPREAAQGAQPSLNRAVKEPDYRRCWTNQVGGKAGRASARTPRPTSRPRIDVCNGVSFASQQAARGDDAGWRRARG